MDTLSEVVCTVAILVDSVKGGEWCWGPGNGGRICGAGVAAARPGASWMGSVSLPARHLSRPLPHTLYPSTEANVVRKV